MPEALLYRFPWINNYTKDVAVVGVEAMLAGIETQFDTKISEGLFHLATFLLPKRVVAMGCMIMWNPSRDIRNSL
jgi:hypothetical protein